MYKFSDFPVGVVRFSTMFWHLRHKFGLTTFPNLPAPPLLCMLGLFSSSYCMILSLLVPSRPPEDLHAYENNSTSIIVWSQSVPECCRHGIIRGYRLYLKDCDSGDFVANSTMHDTPPAFLVSGLKKFYSYNVSMLAFTAKGSGPLSEQVTVTTGEDGEHR